ncbi:MAG: GTPase domain-containing protein [Lachnospiraceae bacterium]|nr:GTPase domain-containing protein [Lachnospiraceae bacterium]
METEITCLTKHRRQMEDYAVLLNTLLKDTDDENIKSEAKSFLTDVSQIYRILVVGGENTGRTTVLRNCFAKGDELTFPREKTIGIREFRYSVQEAVVPVENGYIRQFVANPDLEGLALFDMGNRETYQSETTQKLAVNADVIVAVFSPENIQDDYVWDFIEKNALGKKVVCVLTKADLYPSEIIEQKKKKLLGYMQDAKLVTPVFAVSDTADMSNGYDIVQKYIRSNIIGANPAEQKKQEQFQAMLTLQKDFRSSVEKRCQQFETDHQLLMQIDACIRDFYDTQETKISSLKKEVSDVIFEEITKYQNTILKQFEPSELNRNPNIENKKAFMKWMQNEMDHSEHILNNRVNAKKDQVLRHYLADIDDVCTKLNNWLVCREITLSEKDLFFGTISQSKSTITNRTIQVMEQNHKEYQTIINASEELLNQMLAARNRYELQTTVTTGAATIAGAATPIVVASTLKTVTGVTLLAAQPAAVVVLTLVLGSLCYEAGKHIADIYFSGKLVKNTEKYIAEFRTKIAEARTALEGEVMTQLDELFENEFRSLDRNLLSFRTATNIDAKNIPLLKSRLEELDSFMEQFLKENTGYEYN